MKQKIRTRFHDKNINALETTIETIKCITFSDTFFQMKSFFNMEKDFIWKKILRRKKKRMGFHDKNHKMHYIYDTKILRVYPKDVQVKSVGDR